jgi:methanogenic corrinoid protein MtbC1
MGVSQSIKHTKRNIMAEQAVLDEYKNLMEEIVITYQYGEAFVKAILLAITMYGDASSRNSYIETMGKTFSIPHDKVERVITLLPS